MIIEVKKTNNNYFLWKKINFHFMKQLLPKLKQIDCKKLISKKKSQIDRASLPKTT